MAQTGQDTDLDDWLAMIKRKGAPIAHKSRAGLVCWISTDPDRSLVQVLDDWTNE